MIQASDQGATITVDGGKTWGSWYNQPTAQFYHVITDNQFPYHLYGSQQDSGTVALPSRTDHGDITEYDRFNVGDAESGYIVPDPKDPNISYVSNTYGTLKRFDKRTSQGQIITPWPAQSFGVDISQRKYRFPWTAPLVFSPVDHALYYGAQYVLKTVDGGLTWQEISPDLTGADKNRSTGEVTVENSKVRGYGVVYSIAPSPTVASDVWAGSDTGLIHLTRDGGKTWQNVTPPGLTSWSKITNIEASRYHAGFRCRGPASFGRLQALSVPHSRLRKNLDQDYGWNRGECIPERDSRGYQAPGAALRGHRIWRLRFFRRGRSLAIAAAQSPHYLRARSGNSR
jgi:hypothetical protein